MVKNYISGAHGAIIVADLTRHSSLTNTIDFANNFIEINPEGKMLFVGNKIDLNNEIQISEDEFQSNFSSFNSEIFFTSAKSGENVESLFLSLGSKLVGTDKSA